MSHSGGYNPYEQGGYGQGYSAPPGAYPPQNAQVSPEAQQWFNMVDQDRSGKINANELKAALVNGRGQHFSDTACKLMIIIIVVSRSSIIFYPVGNAQHIAWGSIDTNIRVIIVVSRSSIIFYPVGNAQHIAWGSIDTNIRGMFDNDASGTIDIYEFEKLFQYINQWLQVFKTYDRDSSGHIDESELTSAFTQMGFRFSPDFIQFLVKKSDPQNQKEISVDQFIVLCVQIQRFTEAFRQRDVQQNGIITIGFEDFLTVALGCSV